ncbi:MAG: phospholipase D-like domain-containing protein, partial [Planctomycetota bacterium]
FVPLERLARATGAMPAVGGNRLHFLSTYEEIADQLVADIDAAEDHVHVIFFIYRDDAVGRRVGEALMRAARRGVVCRVLADETGSWRMFTSLGPRMVDAGVYVQMAMPVNPLRRRLSRFDLRNHRKLVVIDGRVGYIGSWNCANAGFAKGADWPLIDLMARVTGPGVLQCQLMFVEDWQFETGEVLDDEWTFPQLSREGESIVQSLPSDPLNPMLPVRDLTVAVLYEARRRVTISTPYLIPDEVLTHALISAVRRGVQVDVILPAASDHPYVDAAARAHARDLIATDVNVYMYQKGFLHTKALTVDDRFGMVGSANFDIRSFRLNIEANLLVYSEENCRQLREIQEGHIAGAERFDPYARNWLVRIGEHYAKLLSPLM